MGEDEITVEPTVPQGTGSVKTDEVPQFIKDMEKVEPTEPAVTTLPKPIKTHVENPRKIRASYIEEG